VEGSDVRLECTECGAHRLIGSAAYSWSLRSGTGITCATCLHTAIPDATANPVPFAKPAPRFVSLDAAV